MSKHHSEDERLQELYNTVRDIDGVCPIDGRSVDISFVGSVSVLQKIVRRLNRKFGKPIQNHPLLDDIRWHVRDDFYIVADKASSLDDDACLHSLRCSMWGV